MHMVCSHAIHVGARTVSLLYMVCKKAAAKCSATITWAWALTYEQKMNLSTKLWMAIASHAFDCSVVGTHTCIWPISIQNHAMRNERPTQNGHIWEQLQLNLLVLRWNNNACTHTIATTTIHLIWHSHPQQSCVTIAEWGKANSKKSGFIRWIQFTHITLKLH